MCPLEYAGQILDPTAGKHGPAPAPSTPAAPAGAATATANAARCATSLCSALSAAALCTACASKSVLLCTCDPFVRSSAREQRFCEANFLSLNTLQLIDQMREQYLELPRDIGFVARDVRSLDDVAESHENRNAGSEVMLNCVLAAALAPILSKWTKPSSTRIAPMCRCAARRRWPWPCTRQAS